MKIAKLLSMLVGLCFVASAGAVSVTWNTAGQSFGAFSGSIYCSTSTCSTSAMSGSNIIKLTAYSTQTLQTNATISPNDTGTWIAAQIAMYSGGGIGITNAQQSGADASSPQHAIDNRGVDDILLVDFNPNNISGQNNWDVSAFSLGWACSINTTTGSPNNSSNSQPSTGTTAADCLGTTNVNFDAWIGSSINTSTIAFASNGTGAALPGFTALTIAPDSGGTGSRSESTSTTGRYLVITGSLGGSTDAFKLSGITAVAPPPGGGGSAPVPGSVPLVALALLALTWQSRRRPAKAHR